MVLRKRDIMAGIQKNSKKGAVQACAVPFCPHPHWGNLNLQITQITIKNFC